MVGDGDGCLVALALDGLLVNSMCAFALYPGSESSPIVRSSIAFLPFPLKFCGDEEGQQRF